MKKLILIFLIPLILFGQTVNIDSLDVVNIDSLNTVSVTGSYQNMLLGNELVTNGAFDNSDDWSTGGGWTISGGVASYSDVATSYLQQTLSLTIGKTYVFQFTVLNVTTNANMTLANQAGSTYLGGVQVYTNGVQNVLFTPSIAGTSIRIYGYAASSDPFDIDNVSVKEVIGYSRPAIHNFIEPQPTSLSETGLVSAWGAQPIGNTWVDLAGTNNGTITGAYWADAMVFDGVDDYVGVADDNSLDFGTDNFTIMAQLKPTTLDDYWLTKGDHLELYAFDGYVHYFLDDGVNTTSVTADGVGFTLNQWNYVAIVFDRGSDQITRYMDGVQTGTVDSFGSVGSISNANPLRIATRDVASFYDGIITNLRIYNTALTSSQIVSKYNTWADDMNLYETFEGKTIGISPDHDWTVGTGTYSVVLDTISGVATNVLNCSSGGTIYTSVDLSSYVNNGQLSYDYKDGTWSAVSETVSASSLFSYSGGILTLTLATDKRIANIKILKSVTQ